MEKKKVKKEIKDLLDLTENEIPSIPKLWNITNEALPGKFTPLNA